MSELLLRPWAKRIRIETVLAGGLWRIHADPNQLENTLLNLAVNARDAMPEAGSSPSRPPMRTLTIAKRPRIPALRPGNTSCSP
jgi:signal transduction histidine kinase